MIRALFEVRTISIDLMGNGVKDKVTMSQHPSLKGKGSIKAKRSVLKRFERVDLLKKRGQFNPNQKVIGLPKTTPDL